MDEMPTPDQQPSIDFQPAKLRWQGPVVPIGTPIPIAPRRCGKEWLVIQLVSVGRAQFTMVSVGIWWLGPNGHVPSRNKFLHHMRENASIVDALSALDPKPEKAGWGSREGQLLRHIFEGVTDTATLAQHLYGSVAEGGARTRALLAKARKGGLILPGRPLRLSESGLLRIKPEGAGSCQASTPSQ